MTRRVVVRTLAFHAAGPGSIPGRRHRLFFGVELHSEYFSRLYYKARKNIDISTAYVIRVQKIKKIFLLPFSTKHPLANGIMRSHLTLDT